MGKKKITNTENSPEWGWVMGGNPRAIEEQERQGQQELVEASYNVDTQQLPRNCNFPRGIDVLRQYEELGVTRIMEDQGDPLFVTASLPKGWKIVPTDHSMWSRLLDDKGRERASIFYKAAFYDRDAFINFNHRYISTSEYLEKKEGDKYHPKYYCVKDISTDKELFTTKATEEYDDSDLRELADNFLNENFPDHKKITAYWD